MFLGGPHCLATPHSVLPMPGHSPPDRPCSDRQDACHFLLKGQLPPWWPETLWVALKALLPVPSTCPHAQHSGHTPVSGHTYFRPMAPFAQIPHWSGIPSPTGCEPRRVAEGVQHGSVPRAGTSQTLPRWFPVRQLLFLPHFTGRKLKVSDSQDQTLVVELGLSPGVAVPNVYMGPSTPHKPLMSLKRKKWPEVFKGGKTLRGCGNTSSSATHKWWAWDVSV